MNKIRKTLENTIFHNGNCWNYDKAVEALEEEAYKRERMRVRDFAQYFKGRMADRGRNSKLKDNIVSFMDELNTAESLYLQLFTTEVTGEDWKNSLQDTLEEGRKDFLQDIMEKVERMKTGHNKVCKPNVCICGADEDRWNLAIDEVLTYLTQQSLDGGDK